MKADVIQPAQLGKNCGLLAVRFRTQWLTAIVAFVAGATAL